MGEELQRRQARTYRLAWLAAALTVVGGVAFAWGSYTKRKAVAMSALWALTVAGTALPPWFENEQREVAFLSAFQKKPNKM